MADIENVDEFQPLDICKGAKRFCEDMANTNEAMDDEDIADIFDILPWDDILFRHIFSYLRVRDLLKLRCCQKALICVDEYFTKCRVVNLSYYQKCRFNGEAFKKVCHSNTIMRTLLLKGHKHWLTDALLMPVFDVCHSLQKVDLAGCSSLTTISVIKLTSCSPNLHHLRMTDCHWVNQECIMAISKNCRKLQSLEMEACWSLTEEALIMLPTACPSIETLSLAKIYSVTDRIVVQVANFMKQLKKLSIFNCWRVTNSAVSYLGEYAKHLEKLEARNCPEVTEVSLAKLRRKGVKLDVILPPWSRCPKTQQLLGNLRLQPT